MPRSSANLPQAVDVIVIGAGHAGLATSAVLKQHNIDHVVLEKGEVANSWKFDRWDSLKLLTPNWMCQMPGYRYHGDDPDGFMSKAELISVLEQYAVDLDIPIQEKTSVSSVSPNNDGYSVTTNKGNWSGRAVVIANGAFNIPAVPKIAEQIPKVITQLTTKSYKNPQQIPAGGVLVVGASATGLQLAAELHSQRTPVTLAVGEHVRMPRTYRGKDIQFWMDRVGIFDERFDEVEDLNRARKVPSPQLVGNKDLDLSLNSLSESGVCLVGRVANVNESLVQFSGSLKNVCALADLKMNRLLKRIDDWIDTFSYQADSKPAFRHTDVPETPRLSLDLTTENVRTIVWATGFRSDYSWLNVPAFNRKGQIEHSGGIVNTPGLYVLGSTFLRTRKSSYIAGIENDVNAISDHLVSYLHNHRSPMIGFGLPW